MGIRFLVGVMLVVAGGMVADAGADGNSNDKVSDAVAAVRQVDVNGQGHEQAVLAMRVLNAASPEQIPIILEGMDDANKLVVNWLRSAVVTIEPTQVQEHAIRLMDDENPHRRSRPRGVMSCEVIGFVGNSHPGERGFKPFGITTRMHKVVSFPATDVGKTAWYRFRWINTRGIEGPWSTTYTATITG